TYLDSEYEQAKAQLNLLNYLSYTNLASQIEIPNKPWDPELSNSLREHYASKASVSLPQFTEAVKIYMGAKYSIRAFDFADMKTFPIWYLSQYQETLQIIHMRYRQFLLDESQDSSCNEISLIMLSDKDACEQLLSKVKGWV
ncbi:MAG: UvrD-helicase domain-containing protein, partial [Deltaproteobacteria bacterium]|nr:UvrD-helicase domain-containing protein [Deltaproteobacteria bacterium]